MHLSHATRLVTPLQTGTSICRCVARVCRTIHRIRGAILSRPKTVQGCADVDDCRHRASPACLPTGAFATAHSAAQALTTNCASGAAKNSFRSRPWKGWTACANSFGSSSPKWDSRRRQCQAAGRRGGTRPLVLAVVGAAPATPPAAGGVVAGRLRGRRWGWHGKERTAGVVPGFKTRT